MNTNERETNASGQFLVRWSAENKAELCALLKAHGYKGSGGSENGSGYTGVNVFCVDKKEHRYYKVSASTCAAWRQSGIAIHAAGSIEKML